MIFALVSALLLGQVLGQTVTPPNSKASSSRLWSTSSAATWNNSYLIGNGRLGGAVPGNIASELVYINEDSFWSGGFIYRVNQDALSYLPELQQLVRDGRVVEATNLADIAYTGTPLSARHYDTLATWEITMNHSSKATNGSYERYLDIDDATSGVFYDINGTAYSREYIASQPAGVVAVRIASNTTGAVSLQAHIRRAPDGSLNRFEDYSRRVGNDTMVMGGNDASYPGIQFSAGTRVVAKGGSVYAIGDTVVVDHADEAWLYLQSWTTYRKDDPEAAVLSDLAAIERTYPEIRAEHVTDYQSYAHRVDLSFGNSSAAQLEMTTSQRVAAANSTFDPGFTSLFFQFGRYLLIASSRNGTLAANLQGIWNSQMDPFWGSKYTTNINVEMNYWPALVTNLADLQGPLDDLIAATREKSKNVSAAMYGVENGGWVLHHNTDMWGDAAPQDNYIYSTWWASAAPWMVSHQMEKYRFTGDTTYLRNVYPNLKSAAQFFVGFLSDFEGYKVVNPTISPENAYYPPGDNTTAVAITLGATMDTELLWELFNSIKEANELLHLGDDAFVAQLEALEAKLPPYRENYFGGLQEWIHDYQEAIPGIDHLSPLWAAYPGNQITSYNMTLFNWARETLNHRLQHGSASGGWGTAWCTALSGRFFRPDWATHCITHLLGTQLQPDSLLNNGAPSEFQADANYGMPAGMMELLVQSHESISTAGSPSGYYSPASYGGSSANSTLTAAFTGDVNKAPLIRLLPALPEAFATAGGGGYVIGLRARGGFEVGIIWDAKGGLVSANITSLIGGTAYVTLGDTPIGQSNGTAVKAAGTGSGVFLKLSTQAGQSYAVTKA
ncbi:hypothetical protein LTR01_002798 [Friedmanniomyces endolithicus]|nr:hypothetical protein LTR01_002798 [Friedmanniomyces endolithicus]KAK0832117.1 hypothetical protein LTR73_002404 [Friedmanniomyces endolithicus]